MCCTEKKCAQRGTHTNTSALTGAGEPPAFAPSPAALALFPEGIWALVLSSERLSFLAELPSGSEVAPSVNLRLPGTLGEEAPEDGGVGEEAAGLGDCAGAAAVDDAAAAEEEAAAAAAEDVAVAADEEDAATSAEEDAPAAAEDSAEAADENDAVLAPRGAEGGDAAEAMRVWSRRLLMPSIHSSLFFPLLDWRNT